MLFSFSYYSAGAEGGKGNDGEAENLPPFHERPIEGAASISQGIPGYRKPFLDTTRAKIILPEIGFDSSSIKM
jgi:hypothetical protein